MDKTPTELREYIMTSTLGTVEASDDSYQRGCEQAAKEVLLYLEAHPEHQELDAWQLADYCKLSPELEGITGFMWGWGVNTAKYILGKPLVPNPALLTVSVPDGKSFEDVIQEVADALGATVIRPDQPNLPFD